MAIQRFNAVGGYSTGITGTAVIDSLGNITGVGATFSGAVTIPLNTAPALTIGTHATKNLVMSSIDGTGVIEQAGNSTATLLIRQQNGGNVQVGGAVNNTFVLINDNDQYLQIQNAGAVYIGDAAGEVNGTYLTIDDPTTSINAIANIFNVIGVATVAGRLDANGGISAAGGVTFAGTFSGSTGSFSRLLTASAGISASGGITLSGTLNLDTNALISSPSATAKAIKSTVPAGTGVTPTVQIICPSSAQSLLSQIATQPVFSTPQDTITLQASTTYMFEGVYLLSTGTVSHSTSMSFVLTTATMTNCTWITNTSAPSALNATAAGISTAIFNSVTGGTLNGANVQPYTIIRFQGVMRVNSTAGTLVPNIAFSAAPGGTNTTMIGSYLKFYPIGSNTIDFIGTAIG